MVWLLVAVGLLILILGIVYIVSIRKKKRPVDYYNFFIMGIIWAGAGIPLKNFALSAMGIIFMILGLVNKDKWKQNRRKWKDLTKGERKITLIIMFLLLLLIVAGFILLIINI